MDNGKVEEIRREMARIRRELSDDVGEVVENARELADWRHIVRSHPWLCMAAAASVGFLLVPRRLNVISPDAETLANLAKQNRLIVKAKPQVDKRGAVLRPVVKFIGGVAIRSAMTSAGQYASKLWTDGATRPTLEPEPTQHMTVVEDT